VGAPSQTYVDPSIAADSGSGTVGDPYGDLQYALNQITRDGTNGDQINIKAGTEEILAAALTLATYGTPTETAPLIFRGYTSGANDGGIGVVDGNSLYALFASDPVHTHLIDLGVRDGPAGYLVSLGTGCTITDCTIQDGNHGVHLDGANCSLVASHVYSFTGIGVKVTAAGCRVALNYIEDGESNQFTTAVDVRDNAAVEFNLIRLSGNGYQIGIYALSTGSPTTIEFNSLSADSSTAQGINVGGAGFARSVLNNVVYGFATDINLSPSAQIGLYGANAAGSYTINGEVINALGDNETLASDPFTDAANGDFTLVSTLDAWPTSFKGASCYTDMLKGAVQEGSGTTGSGGPSMVVVPAHLRRRQPARHVRRRSSVVTPVVIANNITDDSPKIVSPVRKRMVRLIRRPIQHLVCQQVNQTTNVFVENRLIRK